MVTHSVYVVKGGGQVLYVGSTSRGMPRLLEHRRLSEWWPLMTAMTWHHRKTREAALKTERRLIKQLKPKYNRQ